MSFYPTAASIAAAFFAGVVLLRRYGRSTRPIAKDKERVLVIGGSSGIGRAISHLYSQRGAQVCIVGRRQDELEKVRAECVELRSSAPKNAVISVLADFSDAKDMVRLRETLETAWNGVDTMIVCAGVSALRPLLEIAGVTDNAKQASADDVQRTIDVSNAAIRGNYTGPLVSAVTFIPLLKQSSPFPAMLLISSLASLIPAPTRSLYGSTKAASLLLYQALAIEHPQIIFTSVIPSTVEGVFRASAVDGGPVRESDPNKHGLKKEYVAQRCVEAVDNRDRTVFLPYWYSRVGHALYWILPGVTEQLARKKYNF
ncbi:NAD(P)-binding protein [Trametopsis cervina]|nr:NAD(P)-binding protein [Trametopsis cervina]